MSTFITNQMLDDAILAQEATFDSHDVIRLLMQRHPQEYVRDLYTHVKVADPIRTYHALLGKRLSGLGTLEPLGDVDSPNVRGGRTGNQKWRRK